MQPARPEKREASSHGQDALSPISWEAFYTNYRKPDYVPGYEIVNKLGSGVFGVVFKARKKSIGKWFAIKFLRVDDLATREAILKEIDAVRYFAQIDHPNLVSIEDKGQVDGIPFIIMGYAGEETLRKRLNEGRMDPEEVASIFTQVCRGIAALHERSLVHFDVKPANVYLKGDLAKVGDYGLSRLLTESRNTLSFGRGTPYYMAPEMARLLGDHRSDIYSLGVLLFECFARRVPFQGTNEFEVMRKHAEDPLVFPDEVPQPYRSVIAKAMAKEPAARHRSVPELIEDVDRAHAQLVPGSHIATPAGVWTDRVGGESTVEEHVVERADSVAPEVGRRPSKVFGGVDEVGRAERPSKPRSRDFTTASVAGFEAALTALVMPLRWIAVGIGRCLEGLVLLPFRMAEWTIKAVLFILGVALFFKVGEVLRLVLMQLLT